MMIFLDPLQDCQTGALRKSLILVRLLKHLRGIVNQVSQGQMEVANTKNQATHR